MDKQVAHIILQTEVVFRELFNVVFGEEFLGVRWSDEEVARAMDAVATMPTAIRPLFLQHCQSRVRQIRTHGTPFWIQVEYANSTVYQTLDAGHDIQQARAFVEETFAAFDALIEPIVGMTLIKDGKAVDSFDGGGWASAYNNYRVDII